MKPRGKGRRPIVYNPLVERCADCGMRYDAFRAGMTAADVLEDTRAQVGGRAGTTVGALDSEDDAHLLGAGCAMRRAGKHKRGAWDAAHGPGRCVPEYRLPYLGLSEEDKDWRLRELIASLLLDEEDAVGDESIDVDVSFDVGELEAVPALIDDGLNTICIAARGAHP